MEYIDIARLKTNITKTTKELSISDLKPTIILFDGQTGIMKLAFSHVWQTLLENEKYHLLNYFLHNLENEFDDYIKNVVEFKVEKHD